MGLAQTNRSTQRRLKAMRFWCNKAEEHSETGLAQTNRSTQRMLKAIRPRCKRAANHLEAPWERLGTNQVRHGLLSQPQSAHNLMHKSVRGSRTTCCLHSELPAEEDALFHLNPLKKPHLRVLLLQAQNGLKGKCAWVTIFLAK
eukprot:1161797-Pelagomonas_calceolata.AAC.3